MGFEKHLFNTKIQQTSRHLGFRTHSKFVCNALKNLSESKGDIKRITNNDWAGQRIHCYISGLHQAEKNFRSNSNFANGRSFSTWTRGTKSRNLIVKNHNRSYKRGKSTFKPGQEEQIRSFLNETKRFVEKSISEMKQMVEKGLQAIKQQTPTKSKLSEKKEIAGQNSKSKSGKNMPQLDYSSLRSFALTVLPNSELLHRSNDKFYRKFNHVLVRHLSSKISSQSVPNNVCQGPTRKVRSNLLKYVITDLQNYAVSGLASEKYLKIMCRNLSENSHNRTFTDKTDKTENKGLKEGEKYTISDSPLNATYMKGKVQAGDEGHYVPYIRSKGESEFMTQNFRNRLRQELLEVPKKTLENKNSDLNTSDDRDFMEKSENQLSSQTKTEKSNLRDGEIQRIWNFKKLLKSDQESSKASSSSKEPLKEIFSNESNAPAKISYFEKESEELPAQDHESHVKSLRQKDQNVNPESLQFFKEGLINIPTRKSNQKIKSSKATETSDDASSSKKSELPDSAETQFDLFELIGNMVKASTKAISGIFANTATETKSEKNTTDTWKSFKEFAEHPLTAQKNSGFVNALIILAFLVYLIAIPIATSDESYFSNVHDLTKPKNESERKK